ncbi:phosphoglucomutase/phosphomannomutase PgmG [Aquibaculum arenosum]|uniref:Phosphomannomutase/phosphoglucomutase n=1 Tax=Aquibaculum arenosum TaxID=3032591 RepID=A0ABT5YIN7_9PROT|nr:phosphomannomutase/phosphoglucomutase [Fodinicurvata sp. CAU 1616]MDF2094691.1 phosphomannomutase/phosphoglucomutase [Fodinicurvata sp. CAU 1616]
MPAHTFDPTLLREYDVRGVVGKTLHEADARALGRAVGTAVRRRGGSRVAVCYDGRLSSPDMEAAVVEGLSAAGVTALKIGLGPTPQLYFAVHHLDADGGIMITGSHNPPEYNGFKLVLGKKAVFGEDIQALGRMAAAGDFESGSAEPETHDVFEAYVDRLVQDFHGPESLKIAWDAGNGAAGPAMRRLTERLPGEHILLFDEVDGTFPNHHPDPTVPRYLETLKETVLREGCDLGIAFDGDGDRIGALDGQGRPLWGDQMMLLLARDVLKERPGATIIADVKASQILFDGIAELGGTPLMWKTGHSLIKAKMQEVDSPFAGEMSAHLFFADHFYGHDDGLYAAVRLLNALGSWGKSLAEFRDSLPQVMNTPELRFPCPEERKKPVIEEVRSRLQEAGAEVDATDGVRVRDGSGWWLLRASNTQDVLVARCEAQDEAALERLRRTLNEQLAASGIEAQEN